MIVDNFSNFCDNIVQPKSLKTMCYEKITVEKITNRQREN